MPKDFDVCMEEGGRIRTMKLKGGRHMKVCYDKQGKSHAGYVNETKGKKKEE